MPINYKSAKITSYFFSACFLISPLSLSETGDITTPIEINQNPSAQIASVSDSDISKIFAPKEKTLNYSFDYETLDTALRDVVVQMGPSLRRFANKPRTGIGSRIIDRTQRSPYRLEGSRITFYYLSDKYTRTLSEYKADLIRIANDIDIQSLDRDEQLAFWINLHNVTLIEAIALNHPTSYPAELEIGDNGLTLHDAKLITIKNTPLSLKNIREDIVYSNWDNPAVIYGFYRGDIGGPAIRNFAATRNNVDYLLAFHAYEYITSLRGFHTTATSRKVSKIYDEAKPYFFTNWPKDVEDHLAFYLQGDDLLDDVRENKPVELIEYDLIIADLWGGNNSLSSASVRSRTIPGSPPIIFELHEKFRELKVKGKLKRSGTVTIEDIVTTSSP
ncbi:MAG: DUF547 domain-containing protein [Maricaulaceae bacterium]